MTLIISFACVEEMKCLSQRLLKHQKSVIRIVEIPIKNQIREPMERIFDKEVRSSSSGRLTIPKLRERTYSFILIVIHFILISGATTSTTKYKPIKFYKYCRTYSSKSSQSFESQTTILSCFCCQRRDLT